MVVLVVCERRGVVSRGRVLTGTPCWDGSENTFLFPNSLFWQDIGVFIDKMSLGSSIASLDNMQWKPRCSADEDKLSEMIGLQYPTHQL